MELDGGYVGAHLGGGSGKSSFTDSNGPAVYSGDVKAPTALGGIQLGYNLQLGRNLVLGVEGDISAAGANGTNTCFASSGDFVSANCRVQYDAMSTVTGRVGFATGEAGRTLLYAKGGVAWLKQKVDINTNRTDFITETSNQKWGWTVGAGIERAVAPAWSVKMEYDYADFGSFGMATPESAVLQQLPFPQYVATAPGNTTVTQNMHAVKVGLNMKFGTDVSARFDDSEPFHLRGTQRDEDPSMLGDVEIGGRVWYSSGTFQKDLGATTNLAQQTKLISRLTYESPAVSGEVYGRVDGLADFFLKGFIGGGKLLSGKMVDEDWVIENNTVPYSNTISDPVRGSIAYATADIGYAFLRGAGYDIGAFVGYNHYRENKAAYGCAQVASASINAPCAPPIPGSTLVITEDDTWNSVRVGLNGVFMLTDRLKFTADAAYLPYVRFSGVDDHVLRTGVPTTLSPERGEGRGVQLEAILSYYVTPSFNIGAGARYWAMWATDDATTNAFGNPCPCQTLPARTERFGGFLQAGYSFNSL
ncbi:outer membrane beta-barrel protein [Tardiphaga alba]|uniref:outer membrane beta-barrel protein n=1 Tax=Tardiphaga alba TaxID=340268 RepID=UPI00201213CD|nr:outer membrane beta-barrel protein [Tardiphaga alba]